MNKSLWGTWLVKAVIISAFLILNSSFTHAAGVVQFESRWLL